MEYSERELRSNDGSMLEVSQENAPSERLVAVVVVLDVVLDCGKSAQALPRLAPSLAVVSPPVLRRSLLDAANSC